MNPGRAEWESTIIIIRIVWVGGRENKLIIGKEYNNMKIIWVGGREKQIHTSIIIKQVGKQANKQTNSQAGR